MDSLFSQGHLFRFGCHGVSQAFVYLFCLGYRTDTWYVGFSDGQFSVSLFFAFSFYSPISGTKDGEYSHSGENRPVARRRDFLRNLKANCAMLIRSLII